MNEYIYGYKKTNAQTSKQTNVERKQNKCAN